VSTLLSHSLNIGFFGLYLWGTGWLLWLGAVGAFAIGASLGPNDRRLLFAGLLVGALGNALVAVLQNIASIQTAGLTLFDGVQADGFLGNPIHLEALLLGALALVLGRACRSPLRWAPAVLLLTIGLEFTFERFALVILAFLVLYALYTYGVRRGGVFTLLIVVGYGIGYVSGGSGLGSRVTSGTGETTFGLRLRVWLQSAHYVLHHPVFGVGPGQFRTAMDSSATLSFFQNVLAGKILTDAHDIFVNVAVTTGLLGLACFLMWMFGAARTAPRCCFLGFAAAMFGVELVEPINIAILPLAFLALGAAMAVRSRPAAMPAEQLGNGQVERPPVDEVGAAAPYSRSSRLVTAIAVAMALFVGVTMVTGDVYMLRAEDYRLGHPFNVAAAEDANTLLPYWPDSALQVAQVEAFYSINLKSVDLTILARSRHWAAVAVSRDSSNPQLWTLLAGADAELKDYGLASTEYHRALSCDRYFSQALEGLGRLAEIEGNWSGAAHWLRLALATAAKDPLLAASLRPELARAERRARSHKG
jgi:hypothetical protein